MEAGIISLVDNTEWISPMVIQHKKISDLRIYVIFWELNKVCEHDLFSTPFIEETLENMVGNEVYSFIDGFFGYHQV